MDLNHSGNEQQRYIPKLKRVDGSPDYRDLYYYDYWFSTRLNNSTQEGFIYASEFEMYNIGDNEKALLAVAKKREKGCCRVINVFGQISDQAFKDLKQVKTHLSSGGEITFGGLNLEPFPNMDLDGNFHFLFPDGTRTRDFLNIFPFFEFGGPLCAAVQIKERSWKLLNTQGQLSDDTFSDSQHALKFLEEGNKTKFHESALFTSDADLRLKMYLGCELSIYDLAPEEILSNLVKIQQHEEYIYQMKLKQCKDQQSMEELYQDYSFIAEYIKQTAYETKQKIQKESEYKDKPLF